MEYVLAIRIFCFERTKPSSVMAERKREREESRIIDEREKKQGRRHKIVGPNNGNK
jgi:hypothetical protein